MDVAIWVAVIGMVASILTTVITVTSANNKTREEIKTEQKLQEERMKNVIEKVSELSTETKAHNEYGRQIPVLTEQIKVINHRLDDLERRDAR